MSQRPFFNVGSKDRTQGLCKESTLPSELSLPSPGLGKTLPRSHQRPLKSFPSNRHRKAIPIPLNSHPVDALQSPTSKCHLFVLAFKNKSSQVS